MGELPRPLSSLLRLLDFTSEYLHCRSPFTQAGTSFVFSLVYTSSKKVFVEYMNGYLGCKELKSSTSIFTYSLLFGQKVIQLSQCAPLTVFFVVCCKNMISRACG